MHFEPFWAIRAWKLVIDLDLFFGIDFPVSMRFELVLIDYSGARLLSFRHSVFDCKKRPLAT